MLFYEQTQSLNFSLLFSVASSNPRLGMLKILSSDKGTNARLLGNEGKQKERWNGTGKKWKQQKESPRELLCMEEMCRLGIYL